MEGPKRLTSDLISLVQRNGGAWLVELAEQGRLVGDHAPLRRLAWLHSLGAVSGDSPEQWQEALDRGRKQYNSIVDEYKRQTDVTAQDPNQCNPLSRSANNPFMKQQANDELLKEIWKDVERTFPEVEYLASVEGRKVLQRILFHWCRSVNPAQAASDSYRQGMNELAAVSLAAVKMGEYAEGSWENSESLGLRLCGAQHTEADAFMVFSQLMKMGLRPLFSVAAGGGGGSPLGARGSPIGELPRSRKGASVPAGPPTSAVLARCIFIWDTVVAAVDKDLHSHLVRLEIEPQVFLLRWLRLMFCREYGLDETMVLWDGLFADVRNPGSASTLRYPGTSLKPGAAGEKVWQEASQSSAKLPLVDYFAAALLRTMRGELLAMDQTECLRKLLSGKPDKASGVVLAAAKKLRENPNPGAAAITMAPPMSSLGPGGAKRGGLLGASPLANPLAPGGAPARRQEEATEVPTLVPAPSAAVPPTKPLSGPLGGGPLGGSPTPGLQAASAAADLRTGAAELRRGQQLLSAAAQGAQISDGIPATADLAAAGAVEQMRRRAEASEKELETLKKKANEFIAGKKVQIGELKGQIEERDARIKELEQGGGDEGAAQATGAPADGQAIDNSPELERRTREIDELRGVLQQRDSRIQELEMSLAEASAAQAQAGQGNDAHVRELESTRTQLDEAKVELEKLRMENAQEIVRQRDSRIQELEKSLAEANAAQAQAGQGNDAHVREIESTRTQLDEAKVELEKLRMENAQEIVRLMAENQTYVEKFQQESKTEVEAAKAEANAAKAKADAGAAARASELEARVAAANAATAKAEEGSAARLKELEALAAEASAAKSRVEERDAQIQGLEARLAEAQAAAAEATATAAAKEEGRADKAESTGLAIASALEGSSEEPQ